MINISIEDEEADVRISISYKNKDEAARNLYRLAYLLGRSGSAKEMILKTLPKAVKIFGLDVLTTRSLER